MDEMPEAGKGWIQRIRQVGKLWRVGERLGGLENNKSNSKTEKISYLWECFLEIRWVRGMERWFRVLKHLSLLQKTQVQSPLTLISGNLLPSTVFWGHQAKEWRMGLDFSKPTLVSILALCFNLPSSPLPIGGNGKERLIGQRRVWTCLKTVLWSESNLRCQDISSSVHQAQQW